MGARAEAGGGEGEVGKAGARALPARDVHRELGDLLLKVNQHLGLFRRDRLAALAHHKVVHEVELRPVDLHREPKLAQHRHHRVRELGRKGGG